jgi:hypothetical protein
MTRFAFARATPLLRPLYAATGMGPTRIGARLVREQAGPVLRVRMGLLFRAEIPVSSIAEAQPTERQVLGWGVHGFGGRWLVNTTGTGLVVLRLDPAVRARALGVPVRLRLLELSLADRAGFLAAIGHPTG